MVIDAGSGAPTLASVDGNGDARLDFREYVLMMATLDGRCRKQEGAQQGGDDICLFHVQWWPPAITSPVRRAARRRASRAGELK
jgi:hypothetical protein